MIKLTCCLLVFLIVCCAWPNRSKAAASAEPIKVGVVLPFTNGGTVYANQAKLGLDLAAKEINDGGGILGRQVLLLYEDDQNDDDPAIKVTHKLIEQDKVLAIIGPIMSGGLNAMTPVIEAAKMPMLYATNYEGGKCNRYIFCFNTVPNQELNQLLPYMQKTFGDTYYMLGGIFAWPHKMFEAADAAITKLGGHVLGKEFTPVDTTDFTAIIARIKEKKPKVLLFALKGAGIKFIADADSSGLLKDTTIAFLGMSEADLHSFGGKGQNMYVVVPFVASSDMPSVKAFVAKVKAAGGNNIAVSNYVMTHYNALKALKAAIEKAGKVDKEALVDALSGLTIDTPTGKMTIGKNHHVTMNMFLAKTQGNDLVTVKDLGEIAPEPGCK